MDRELLERLINQLPPGRARGRYERMLVEAEESGCHSDREGFVSPALVDAEETLFRLWVHTLPNKTMARENWEDEFAYYGAQKGFTKRFLEVLKARVEDLR